MLQVFDNADAFNGFRKPLKEVRYRLRPELPVITVKVPACEIAVLVYADINGNGRLDKNFIGIPKEPVGLSNNYSPKGPLGLKHASFQLGDDQRVNLDITLNKVLGDAGQ